MKINQLLTISFLASTISCSDFFLPPFKTEITEESKNEACFAEIYGMKIKDKDSKMKPVMYSLFKDLRIKDESDQSDESSEDSKLEESEVAAKFKNVHLYLVNAGYVRHLKDFIDYFDWVDEKDYMDILVSNGFDKSEDYCKELRDNDPAYQRSLAKKREEAAKAAAAKAASNNRDEL